MEWGILIVAVLAILWIAQTATKKGRTRSGGSSALDGTFDAGNLGSGEPYSNPEPAAHISHHAGHSHDASFAGGHDAGGHSVSDGGFSGGSDGGGGGSDGGSGGDGGGGGGD